MCTNEEKWCIINIRLSEVKEMDFSTHYKQIKDEIITLRREIHKNPELGFEEIKNRAVQKRKLLHFLFYSQLHRAVV